MADYKRIVSYIYNYEFNVKKNNVGYARLETAGKQCKITVHINVLSMNETELKICFLLRGRSGIRCILLGSMVPRNGIGEFRTVVLTDNIMNSGYTLDEMGGMILYASDDKYFGTEWDDQPIRLKKLEMAETKSEAPVIKAAELSVMEPEKEEAVSGEEEAGERKESREPKKPEEREEETCAGEPESAERDEPDNPVSDTAKQREDTEEPVKAAEGKPEEKAEEKERKTVRPGFEPERIMKIFNSYPKLYPFEDSEIKECVRIELQDIGVFPVECWDLANNSFLLHGYYSYRHLIFARKSPGGRDEYLVGVPGFYYNREKFMAGMFGFNQFKSIKNTDQATGEFGYWMKRIS